MSYSRKISLLIFTLYSGTSFTEDTLTSITVTASRNPISVNHTGSSVSIIDKQQINNKQLPFAADLLRDVPGTTISKNGGTGTLTQLRIRGAESNHSLVLIDGIEANDITAGSEFNFANLVTCGLDSIEVLRGPQSSLWGSDALAGVVNIQTRKGQGPINLESTFSTGRFDTRQNCTGISGGNNLQNFSFYSAHYENNGSNISEQGSENDGYRNTTFNGRYGIGLSDNLEINLTGRHVDSTVETDPFDPPIDADRETESIQNYFQFNSMLITLNNAWKHQANISLTDTNNENYADGIEDTSSAGEKLKFDYQTTLYHFTDHTNHSITLAYEREREKFKQTGTASGFGDPNQRQTIYNTGYIGEYRVGIIDQLFLSASLRKDDNDEFQNSYSHRLSAIYTPKASNTSFHGAFGSSVKNPSFTERFGFTPDTFIGNPDIKPEKSKGWEIGISHALTQQLKINTTYFSEKLEDEINGFSFDPSLGGFTAINLQGESDRRGLELSIYAQPLKNLDVSAAYTYVESRQPDTSGKTSEIRVPKNTASLVANYKFLEHRANINLNISYTDDQFDSDFSTFPSARVELGDYTLVNISGEYQINNWLTLQGRIENLFNKDYQNIFGYETPGINAHIGVKFQSTQ
ncbi:MAG: TonB-dependent receptor [Gammaproteobacteria bacterium]|nr:TonB-dependent receptor [Gammaproteobacteria bacterium]